jgi:hypothetical protein
MKFVDEVIAKLNADKTAPYTYNFWLTYPLLSARDDEWFVSIGHGVFLEYAKLNREGFDIPLTFFERWRLTNAYFRAKKRIRLNLKPSAKC